MRPRNFPLSGRSCRSRLLALMTLRARTSRSRLRKMGSRIAHQVMARRTMTLHRVTAMTGQIIATGCPSSTGIQRNERNQPQRQTTASEQAPRQRLETLPPHLAPPGTTPNTTKLQKQLGSCGLRSSCIHRWDPPLGFTVGIHRWDSPLGFTVGIHRWDSLRPFHPESCDRTTGKTNEAAGRVARGEFEWWTSHSNLPDCAAQFNARNAAARS